MTTSGPIGGIWFRDIKNGLCSNLPNHEKLFIVQTKNHREDYIFGAFKSSVDFYLYYRHLEIKQHHEVIPGFKPQKPRFDLDLDNQKLPSGENLNEFGDRIRNSILISCSNVLLEHKTPLESMDDFIIFSSSSTQKYSVHIILSSYYHNNHQEAKEFYFRVIENSKNNGVYDLSEAVKLGILDSQVYKSRQNFRLYLSGKKEGGEIVRRKTYVESINLFGNIHCFPQYPDEKSKLRLFRKSCITDTVGCRYIPIVVPPKKKFDLVLNLPDGYENLLKGFIDEYYPGEFELLENKGSLITTKKLNPSYFCKICMRSHESNSPFLTINKYGDVKIHCYRAIEYANTSKDPNFFTWRKIGNMILPPQEKIETPVQPIENINLEKPIKPTEVSQDEKKPTGYIPPKSEDETWLIKPGKPLIFRHGVKINNIGCINSEKSIEKSEKKPKKPKLTTEYIDTSNTFRHANSSMHIRHIQQNDMVDIYRLPPRYQQLLKK